MSKTRKHSASEAEGERRPHPKERPLSVRKAQSEKKSEGEASIGSQRPNEPKDAPRRRKAQGEAGGERERGKPPREARLADEE